MHKYQYLMKSVLDKQPGQASEDFIRMYDELDCHEEKYVFFISLMRVMNNRSVHNTMSRIQEESEGLLSKLMKKAWDQN